MKNCNFCIHENKVYDLNGYEMLPDKDGVISVILNGMERRFKIDKMINWLKDSGYKALFREPKEIKIIVPKEVIAKVVKIPKPKKPQKVKVTRIKKPPKICKCGAKMTSNTTCRKCYLESKPRQKQKSRYVKVEFDKRKNNGRTNHSRKIECSNGKIYNSIIEAQKEIGVTRSQIWHVLTNKWKQTHNLTFKYL